MSNDTPMTDAEHTRLVRISEGPDWIAGKDYVDMRKHSETLERENARLREEVEMLNVRHAAAMLHAQTHADEYNALREDEKGLLQDIQRLTEEAFKRDEELALTTGTLESRERNIATLQEELAEAKRDTGLAKLVIQQKQDQIASAEAALEQSEARALGYKTEHAALLGTSQWQETEIADLRDDVKRLMQKDVLATLRKPSEAMIEAGQSRLSRSMYAGANDMVEAIFLAMLDQFEKEQQP
jgi:chromosome segregation ATPase